MSRQQGVGELTVVLILPLHVSLLLIMTIVFLLSGSAGQPGPEWGNGAVAGGGAVPRAAQPAPHPSSAPAHGRPQRLAHAQPRARAAPPPPTRPLPHS